MGFLRDLRIISTISKITGTSPFYSIDEKTGEVVIKSLGWFYSVFVVCALELTSLFFLYDILKNTHQYSGLSSTSETNSLNQLFEIILSIFSYCGVLFICLKNSRKHAETLNGIVHIDKEITVNFKANLRVDNRYLTWMFFALFAMALIFSYSYISFKGYSSQDQQILLWCYLIQFIISSSFTMSLTSVIRVIMKRMEFVNTTTHEITQNSNATNLHQLRILFVLYYKLRNVCETVNEGTGISLLLYMAYMFYTITNQSYVIFVTFGAAIDRELKMYMIILSTIWILVQIILVAVLSFYCGNTSQEVSIQHTLHL